MTNFPAANALDAVVARIEAYDVPANDYDVIEILDTILHDYGVQVDDVNEGDFLRLLTLNHRDDKTGLPCPEWCGRPAGHPFENEFDDGRQSRPHETKLPRPDIPGEVYLSLVQEDVRAKGDDSTAVRTVPEVSFAVDASFQSDELRKLAAALLNAADKLDDVNAGNSRQRTEDQL
jgi:hypothetical protein